MAIERQRESVPLLARAGGRDSNPSARSALDLGSSSRRSTRAPRRRDARPHRATSVRRARPPRRLERRRATRSTSCSTRCSRIRGAKLIRFWRDRDELERTLREDVFRSTTRRSSTQTIADGSFVKVGSSFEQTWELENTGFCVWEGRSLKELASEHIIAGARPPADPADRARRARVASPSASPRRRARELPLGLADGRRRTDGSPSPGRRASGARCSRSSSPSRAAH